MARNRTQPPHIPTAPAYLAPVIRQATPAPDRHQSRRLLLLLFGSFALLIIAGSFVLAALVIIYQSNLVMPGVQALEVELGAKSTNAATIALEQVWRGRAVDIVGEEMSWSTSAEMLGIKLDTVTMVQQAYERGRSQDRIPALLEGQRVITIQPTWRLDPEAAGAYLWALAQQFNRLGTNANLSLKEGTVEMQPAVPGRALDVAATVGWLEQHLSQVATEGRLELTVSPVQPAITDVSALVSQANQLLANTFYVHAYAPVTNETVVWSVPPETWGAWLSVGMSPADPTALVWEFDRAGAEAFLIEQAGAAMGPGRYLANPGEIALDLERAIDTGEWNVRRRAYHHPQQHTVRYGDTFASIGREYGIPYPWIQQANPGVSDALSAGQLVNIPSPDDLLPLPIVENKRIVISISQQRMWAYENGSLIWEWPVSTGIPSSPTSPGVFQVQTHELNAYAASWDLWMPHFMGIYRPVPTADFMNGFHGFPTRGGSQLLWTGSLGRPVTYGCILVDQQNAATLYEWAKDGTIVEIRP